MARAITHIDSALIEEANEMPKSKNKILTPHFLEGIYRYGAIAASLVLMIGVIFAARLGGDGVLLYGERITEHPRTITEYIPRAVTYSVEPETLTSVSLPLELEFRRATKLTLDGGTMTVLDEDGGAAFVGDEHVAKGAVSICLSFPNDVTEATITTDRNYNIVLTKDAESGAWYVNIDK